MLLSLISTNGASLLPGLAAAIAQRRAHAGRNVLLLTQCMQDRQPNQYKINLENRMWQAREMKIAAAIRSFHADALTAEITTASYAHYDIITELQQAQSADAADLLRASDMLVFHIQTALWNRDRQTRMMKCIRIACENNHQLPVLVILDDINSKLGQDLLNKLARQLNNVRFLLANTSVDMALGSIYKSIFLPAAMVA